MSFAKQRARPGVGRSIRAARSRNTRHALEPYFPCVLYFLYLFQLSTFDTQLLAPTALGSTATPSAGSPRINLQLTATRRE